MSTSSRRDFFKKMSLGLVGTTTIVDRDLKMPKEEAPIIRNMKPMGFSWETLDPFLFCVHHEDYFPKGNGHLGPAASLDGRSIGDDFIIKDGWRMYHGTSIPGFPGHPHRGFETITVVRKGLVDHADSMGASGRYGEGDVQWMTAGSGVQHSEMFPLVNEDTDNPLELFQIWLNLPAKGKMTSPHFKMMWGSQIPKYTSTNKKNKSSYIEIIAGSLNDLTAPAPPPGSWAADAANEVAILNLRMEEGSDFILPPASEGINRMLYFYEGDQVLIANTPVQNYHSVEVAPNQSLPIQAIRGECKLLLLQAKPIGETVIQYGPFVMNSKQEIQQAFNDYHATQFGGWPWDRFDKVHEKNLGRFAKHADGTIEQGV
ncbi:MAG: pirin family protein [Saprospiraceae bacterium]|jgi:redox-sensitive bicupin YhaK (pirin superfamily)|nr:pirin family protein [Saprospiraceae bacterium]